MSWLDRLQHAWSIFTNRDPPVYPDYGYATSTRPDLPVVSPRTDRSIINSIYTRIAVDCSLIGIKHVKMEGDKFKEEVKSSLNYCLTEEANKDQTGRAFIRDLVYSLLDEGNIAAVPTRTDIDPTNSTFKVEELRTGKIEQYYPDHVQLSVYNEKTGQRQTVTVPKSMCAIIENPFYAVMNGPNSLLTRIIRKMNILDAIDKQSGSGKLDLIIQLPYVINTETRRKQADQRKKDVEKQLENSKYGIVYTDGTERITQLNRPVENNLMKQIEYLVNMLYSQLGITQGILDGTADERTRQAYENGTLEPILLEICEEMTRKFLTKTARTQGQAVKFYRDPFRLLPITQLAELADKLTRNEILTPNELRQRLGIKPVKDEKADELRNRNINTTEEQHFASTSEGGENQNE